MIKVKVKEKKKMPPRIKHLGWIFFVNDKFSIHCNNGYNGNMYLNLFSYSFNQIKQSAM